MSLLRYGGTPDLAFRASYELSKLLKGKKIKKEKKKTKMLIKKKTLVKTRRSAFALLERSAFALLADRKNTSHIIIKQIYSLGILK